MTVAKAFTIIIGTTIAFAILGGVGGACLGHFAPGYYRTVFPASVEPGPAEPPTEPPARTDGSFEPVHLGVGLGVTQGAVGGGIVGCVVVLAVAWGRTRGTPPTDRA